MEERSDKAKQQQQHTFTWPTATQVGSRGCRSGFGTFRLRENTDTHKKKQPEQSSEGTQYSKEALYVNSQMWPPHLLHGDDAAVQVGAIQLPHCLLCIGSVLEGDKGEATVLPGAGIVHETGLRDLGNRNRQAPHTHTCIHTYMHTYIHTHTLDQCRVKRVAENANQILKVQTPIIHFAPLKKLEKRKEGGTTIQHSVNKAESMEKHQKRLHHLSEMGELALQVRLRGPGGNATDVQVVARVQGGASRTTWAGAPAPAQNTQKNTTTCNNRDMRGERRTHTHGGGQAETSVAHGGRTCQ